MLTLLCLQYSVLKNNWLYNCFLLPVKSNSESICIASLFYFVCVFYATLFTFLSQRLPHNGTHSGWMLEMGEVILLFVDLVLSVNGMSEFCLRNVD